MAVSTGFKATLGSSCLVAAVLLAPIFSALQAQTAGASDAMSQAMDGATGKVMAPPVSGHWVLSEKRDALTDEAVLIARIVLSGDTRGQFEVAASCVTPVREAGQINFVDPTKFKFVALDIYPSKGMTFQRDRTSRIGEQCTYLKVRVGDGAIKQHPSTACSDDTWASMSLINDVSKIMHASTGATAAAMQQMTTQAAQGGDASTQRSANSIAEIFGPIMDATTPSSTPIIEALVGVQTQLRDVIAQDSMRVGMVMAGGEQEVIRIPVRDANFLKVAKDCLPDVFVPVPVHADVPRVGSSPDAFSFGTAATVNERMFHGTADQFIAALPSILEKAVRDRNVHGEDYSKEILKIEEIVHACEKADPDVRRYTPSTVGNPVSGCELSNQVSFGVGHGNMVRDRLLVATITKEMSAADHGFTIEISFSAKRGDITGNTSTDPRSLFVPYGIVQARIVK